MGRWQAVVAVTETPEERARRLGLIPVDTTATEAPDARAKRLGLSAADETDGEPGIGSKVLGTVASLVRDIPGGEAAQAGVRSLVRRQSYRDALSDIRTAEDAAPAIATAPARLAGAGLASAALPGGAALKGAQYGALTGALSSDPNSGATSRAIGSGVGAVTGALAGRYMGKAGEKLAPGAGRARDAVLTRFSLRDAVRPAVRLGEASAPKAEGLLGNGMDNVLEAVKAQRSSAAEPILTPGMSIDESLRALLARSRQTLPRGEAASHLNLTDADIAMGHVPDPTAMTMEQALEESIKHVKTGGKLSSVRSATPHYAGRPVIIP